MTIFLGAIFGLIKAHAYKLCLEMKDNFKMKDNFVSVLSANKEAISKATKNLIERSILAQDKW